MLERCWKVRVALSEEEVIQTKDDKYVFTYDGKTIEVSNLDVEFDMWAVDRSEALKKAIDWVKPTRGVVGLSVEKTHFNTRQKQ